jgi:hypothetical protein
MTRPTRPFRRGFTLIEVMFAALLMTVVGVAIVGFMSAYANGIRGRSTMNDPALESSLATRRLATLAPSFCYVLQVNGARAAIWLSDTVPSRSVHLSELGLVSFDEETGEIIFESVNPTAFNNDLTLDREFAYNAATDFIGAMETQRSFGRTMRQILAEGIDSISFSTQGVSAGNARITMSMEGGSAQIALAPAFIEEPLR